MKKIILFSVCLFSLLTLTAAKKIYTYNYLMTHFNTLQAEYSRCDKNDRDDNCDTVKSATRDFVSLTQQRRQNPELFGKQIMENQYQLSQAMKALNQVKPSSEQYPRLKSAYDSQAEKVGILLSITSANGG